IASFKSTQSVHSQHKCPIPATPSFPTRRSSDLPYSGDEMSHRSSRADMGHAESNGYMPLTMDMADMWMKGMNNEDGSKGAHWTRSEEHTSELQSRFDIVCRLLLEKKN